MPRELDAVGAEWCTDSIRGGGLQEVESRRVCCTQSAFFLSGEAHERRQQVHRQCAVT